MVAQHRAHKNKRHGHHQKRSRHFLKVYSPYLPLTLILLASLFFSIYGQPHSNRGVLSYATSVSVSDLLTTTNQERTSNGVAALSLNSQLTSAAQAKANDMVARNYWSHNPPDGSPWWSVITNAGYNYKSAGENLAYGYLTSADAVTGWMNSPGHRANILNAGFSEVGFGFANSANFNGDGEETVVVAEYGSPQVASATTTAPPAPVSAAPAQPTAPASTPTPVAPAPVPTTTKPTTPNAATPTNKTSTTTTVAEPPSKSVSRLQMLIGKSAPWAATLVSVVTLASILSLFVKHSLGLRRALVRGERYVLHHMVFDVTIISLIGLCFIVSRTAVFIR